MRLRLKWLLLGCVLAGSCDTTNMLAGVYCNRSSDCPAATPICDVVVHSCYRPPCDGGCPDLAGDSGVCTSSSQCGSAAPICAAPACRACNGAADDAECRVHDAATPRCGSAGACVACRVDTQATDCPSSAPVCGSASTCRPCRAHSECSSGVCKPDGTCAAATDVAYVNNAITCNNAAHASTPATPYCEIQNAAQNSGKSFIVVAGSATAYAQVNLVASTGPIGPLTIVGPGRGASPTAKIAPTVTPAVALTTAGAAATLTVDGLELIGSGGGSPSPGVKCSVTSGVATLTILNSSIHSSGAAGVDSSGCVLTLDANIIGPSNTAGGIALGNSSMYTITNNIIWGNGGAANTNAAVTFSNSSSGTFAFNTVTNNTVTAGAAGGLDCGTVGMKRVQASILWGNTGSGSAQAGPQCMLMNVVSTVQPTFVSTTDFHLKANDAANAACCVDKITSDPGTSNKDHDVDATQRPKGLGRDIGAHEVQ